MMKKLLSSAFAVTILFGGLFAVSSASANNDCKEVEFSNGETVCVSIENVSTDRFKLVADHVDGTNGTLRCDIMLPNSTLKSIPLCNGNFNFDDNKSGRIKLRIRSNNGAPSDREDKPSSNSIWTYPQWMYDFDNEEWMDSNLSDTNNGDYNADNFYITASPSSPSENDDIDVTVRARDGSSTDDAYRGTVRFKVEKKSGSSSWTTASSSYYDLSRTSYTFTSSDDGEHYFSNLVSFTNDAYDYRLVVTDSSNDIVGYKIFYLDGNNNNNNNNGDLDNFYLTTDDTTPTTSQYVDLRIEARDSDNDTVTDYTDTVNFKVYKRASGSSSWTLTTSSNDYTMDSDYTNGYDFTSSDHGDVTLDNFIKFKRNNYSYKVRVYAEDDTSIYKEITFTVGSINNNGNYDADNFYVTTDDTTPSTTQRVDLRVKARDGTSTDTEYDGDIIVTVYYRTSSSASRTKTTSSSYFEINSTYDDDYDNGIAFASSRNGYHVFTDFIKLKKNYEYKIVVADVDDSDIDGYVLFNSDGDDDNSSVDGFSTSELSTVQSMYNSRPNLIRDLKAQYSKLRNSTTWINRSDAFYDDMKDILDDATNKTYDTYDEYYAGFLSRYRYTISIR